MYYTENSHPAIISAEMFEMAKKEMAIGSSVDGRGLFIVMGGSCRPTLGAVFGGLCTKFNGRKLTVYKNFCFEGEKAAKNT